MDTGLDSPQVQAMRKALGKAAHDPGRLRLIVAGLIGAIGIFGLCRPETARLEESRTKCEAIEATAAEAEQLRQLTAQSDTYAARLPKSESPSDWQDYITQHLEASGVTLRKIEPRKTLQSAGFRVVVVEVTVDGMYSDLVDFIDRLERGDRICRLDRLAFEKRASTLGLRFQFFGLVKPRA
ncbi:MAG: type 4a pilus biogenesis protein PilO [Planctomycetes bacterium]|nr:type 4a pilus biogenesis protein PilO [Planctomycetota bacterium]